MTGLLALTSAKHSPGVTTAAIALALAAGPEPLSLIVEADPAGGDLAARCELSVSPGLGSMAASARHDAAVDLVGNVQSLPAGPAALLAPPSPLLTASALQTLGDRLLDGLADWTGAVIADCGRWDEVGVGTRLIGAADAVLIVLRPTVEDVEHVRARLAEITAASAGALGALIIGDRPYGPAEVADALGLPVAGTLPFDPRAVRALERRTIGAEARRSTIVRSARSALDAMSRWPQLKPEVWA
jgi:MinD-like ATPase involved in chromosome partitioning or flagellar assembly